MKIERITYQKAFITGPFLQEKIGFEAEIDEHVQSVHDALMQLKSMAEDFHKKANPHLYQESAPVQKLDASFYSSSVINQSREPIPIISKDVEKMEIEIDNAKTLEELDAVLNRYVTFPGKLLPQINAKRKQLKALDI
jgi:hypothetical protein